MQRVDIGGVPVFYVATDLTPTAQLSFRAGFADERLSTRGWLHLLEHMAMTDRDDPSFHCNASVGPLLTEFQVQGDLSDVIGFLEGVCLWLSDPVIGDLDHERAVLEAEASRRQLGDVTGHLDYRYGAVGIGTSNYPEFGLRTATEGGLRALAARLFVRGNAALALNVAPPEGLRLPLPAGPRVPAPSPRPLPLRLPGHAFSATGDLAVSGLVDDGQLSMVVGELASRAVTKRLRHELGSSYACQFHVERVDETLLQLMLIADVVPEKRSHGVELMSFTLRDLLANGVTPESLSPLCARLLRQLRDAPDGAWQAFNSAQAHLRGGGHVTEDDVAARLSSITVDEVRGQLGRMLETALYTSSVGKDSTTDLPFNEGVSEAEMTGQVRKFRPWSPLDSSLLEVSSSSCRITGGDVLRTRSLESLVAYLRYPDGARTLVSPDGGTLHIEPNVWARGTQAVEMLDQSVASDVAVDMPERLADSIEPLPPRLRRSLHWLAALPTWLSQGLLVLVVLAIGVLIPGGVLLVLLLGASTWGFTKWMEARDRRRQ